MSPNSVTRRGSVASAEIELRLGEMGQRDRDRLIH
jgi:hypothetical protein